MRRCGGIIASFVWLFGLAGLDLEWVLKHGFDATALAVGIAALLPSWTFIASEVDFSLLGQKFHIKAPEVEKAIEKVEQGSREVPALPPPPQSILRPPKQGSFGLVQLTGPSDHERFAEYLFGLNNPNLALVGLRIDIEKKVTEISDEVGILPKRSLTATIRELQAREILPGDLAQGLLQFVDIGNRAAHGAEVDLGVAGDMLGARRTILSALDSVLARVKEGD